jgi:Domain of unknown function (DUF4440)
MYFSRGWKPAVRKAWMIAAGLTLASVFPGSTASPQAKPPVQPSARPPAGGSHEAAPGQMMAGLTGTLASIERGFFEAWKDGKPDFFDRNMAPEGIFFGQYGISEKENVLAAQRQSVGHCSVSSYQLTDFHAQQIASGVALLTYRAEQHGTCFGTAFDPYMNGLSVYVQRGGRWLNVVRSEVPAKNWPIR